jgi:GNAT superfamily N-acetyltransferase
MTNPVIQLRMARAVDAPAISSVLYESFIEYQPWYSAQGFAATTPTVEQLLSRMSEGPVWVALRHDAIVGTVSAIAKGETFYVRGMGVIPSARGQGIASLLLQQAEDAARAAGCQRIVLSTTPFLASAIRLYERSGFQRSEEGPHELFGTPLFTMLKRLPTQAQPSRR